MSEIQQEVQPILIDVRSIPKPQRHPLIFDALDALAVGHSAIVKNDHDPVPLRGQVETIYGAQFAWNYLESGPEIFQLQFTRQAAAPANWQRPKPQNFQSNLPLASAPEKAAALHAAALRVDVVERLAQKSHSGPQWAHECDDLDLTLLAWAKDKRIEAHINDEVDVVFMGVAGVGKVTVNGEKHALRPGVVLLIPKGCERAIESDDDEFAYLSVHRRRRGLMPTWKGGPKP